MYDSAAIRLRGSDAMTNFVASPAEAEPEMQLTTLPDEKLEDECRNLSSPTSVLRFSSSDISQESIKEEQDEAEDSEKLDMLAAECFPIEPTFLSDFPPLEVGFLEDSSPQMFMMEDFADYLINDYGSSMSHIEDYFQDIGDLFSSDPLISF